MCFPLNFKMLFPKGEKNQYDWPSTVAQIRSQVLLAWDCIAKAINSAFLLKLKSAGWHPTEFPKAHVLIHVLQEQALLSHFMASME